MKEPLVLDKITEILEGSNIRKGNVLGIGSSPHKKDVLYLEYFRKYGGDFNTIGINLDGQFGRFNNFEVIKNDAHEMIFDDNFFSVILCNSMLEHDGEFWLTIKEVKRVLKTGGLFIVCCPGYVDELAEEYADLKVESDRIKYDFCCATMTYQIHGDDYYRFSERSFKEVIFKGMKDVGVISVMRPPRVIGWGYGNE